MSGGNDTVYLCHRGGGNPIKLENVVFLEWERILNDSAEASVGLTCWDHDFYPTPGYHEIRINADGVEVWVGPLVDFVKPISDGEKFLIKARCKIEWLKLRAVHKDIVPVSRKIVSSYIDENGSTQPIYSYDPAQFDPVAYARLIIKDAMAPEDSPDVASNVRYQLGRDTSSSAEAFEAKQLLTSRGDFSWEDGLAPMLGSEISMSSFGKYIFVWGANDFFGETDAAFTVRERDLVGDNYIGVSLDSYASRWIGIGARVTDVTVSTETRAEKTVVDGLTTSNTTTYASDFQTSEISLVAAQGGTSSLYGLIERKYQNSKMTSLESLKAAVAKVFGKFGQFPIPTVIPLDGSLSTGISCDSDFDWTSAPAGARCLISIDNVNFDSILTSMRVTSEGNERSVKATFGAPSISEFVDNNVSVSVSVVKNLTSIENITENFPGEM